MVKTLADEGLAGLKDSAFDLVSFYEFLVTVTNPEFTPIVGTEAIAAGAVEAGAKGIVSGLANVWPELMGELWAALQTNDGRKCGSLQLRVNQARSIMKYGPTLVVCYDGLKMRGINAGFPRAPYSPLSDELNAKIKAAFADMGLFN
jgi:4-hydroxy-tetrahydrodipicolinate synthase